ncbi:MAG: response regulator [Candidatus Omnitrophica bacterium]|nr:response regulator [Candidatus Omnitrophota bacterium]
MSGIEYDRYWSPVFDVLDELVFLIDHDFTLVKVNKGFIRFTGKEEKELIGRKYFEIIHGRDGLAPEGMPPAIFSPAQPEKREIYEPDFKKWLWMSTTPIFGQSDRIVGFIYRSNDITKHKRVEEELKKNKEKLEIQIWGLNKTNEGIKLLYKEIEKKNKELQGLDQLKSDFISTVSHELRTPLTTMKEFTSIILDEIPGKLSKEQKEYVEIIRGNIDRLARLINNLLDISKIEAGRTELKKTLVDITNLAESVVSTLKPEAEGKHIEFRTLFPAFAIDVYADPDKVIQIFTNLIGNAIKFTQELGQITVEIIDKGNEIECSVADTGRGIAPEDMGKLFTKFQQFGRVAGAGAKGTGLGLAITKGLIQKHNGRIWAESKIREGSKFIFNLPKKTEFKFLQEALELEVSQEIDSEEYCTLLIIETLNFNSLKQELGRNDVMRLSSIIRNMISVALRKSEDALIRIGDNKIAVVLVTKKIDDAAGIIDRLRLSLQKKLFFKKEFESKVEFSLGVGTYEKEVINIDSMIEAAGEVYKRLTMPIIGKREIVVVDDEESLLATVKLNLEETDEFRVYTYSKAVEALEGIAHIMPEVIITDITMPEMNGYELIGRLYEYEGCEYIPVIFITGHSFDDKELAGLRLKKIVKLSKPFEIKELIDKINLVSNRRS